MLKVKSPKNSNYSCLITKISSIVPLQNCDNIAGAIVSGYSVVTKKTDKVGDIGVFFPVETLLSQKFCYENSLYTEKELNKDKNKKGYVYFYNTHNGGRLKCVAFRGNKSEGIFLPLSSLSSFLSQSEINKLEVGQEFDELNGENVCKKYVAIDNTIKTDSTKKKKQVKKVKRVSRLVDGQFNLHQDTSQLKKNFHNINPTDYISVNLKYHGTSFVVGKPLVAKKLSFFEKCLKKIGINIWDVKNEMVYASRNVIKNEHFEVKNKFAKELNPSVWDLAAEKLKDIIPSGFTVYGEIIGYHPSGKMVQDGYHYGCESKTQEQIIYRITQTNNDGQVTELSWNQIKDFCNKFGLKSPHEFFYGQAKDLFKEIEVNEQWRDNVLTKLCKSFHMEEMCPWNGKEVCFEGLIIRKDNLYNFDAFKLKSFKFLEQESKWLDSGILDTETEESRKV